MSVTTLPGLTAGYDIMAEQVSEFQRNGHILMRNVASAEEVAAYRSVILTARVKKISRTLK